MAKNYAHVRQQILANMPFIKKELEQGKSKRSIYFDLLDKGKLSGGHSAFSRQLNLILKNPNQGNFPESSHSVVVSLPPKKTASTAPKSADTPDSLPLFGKANPSRATRETVSSRRARVLNFAREDKAASDQRALALIAPVGKD